MLTKDLILCRSQKGFLKPQFISVDAPELLRIAQQLLALYSPERRLTRGDIAEQAEPLVKGLAKWRVAKGILKVMDDCADFSTPQDLDYCQERKKLFALSSTLIRSRQFADETAYQQALMDQSAKLALRPGNPYFADLPENDRLASFSLTNATQALERYNIGLVQGLLLRASRLEVTAADEEPQRLRRLCKYLKFFRLMAQARRDAASGGIHMEIDGPASILDQSKRYGLQLATFFPAVCSLRHWKIRAEVEWQDRHQWLVLDQTSGLVCHYHNFAAVVPEEIALFQRHFSETAVGWTISSETPFLTGKEGTLFFPDFSFQSADRRTVHLELFHRWHSTQLLERLAFCEEHPESSMLLGVDRTLTRDENTQARLESSEWFQKHGFLFRDYPTVDKTLRLLNNQPET